VEGASDGLGLGFRCVQVAGPRSPTPRRPGAGVKARPGAAVGADHRVQGADVVGGSRRISRASSKLSAPSPAPAAGSSRPVSKLRPRCGHVANRPARVRGPPRPTVPHNRGMPLQIHIQPDPDHLCETCGGPSELTSHSITRWLGNKMAREVSPPTPRCVDPSCQSRRPRHLRRVTCPWGCGVVAAEGRCEQITNGGIGTRHGLPGR